jgi:hypothetical protein
VLALIVGVFKIISLTMVLETRGPSGSVHPWPTLALEPMSPRPPSLAIGRQGIRIYVLERDDARRLHLSYVHEVAQLKARMDYL